MNVASALTLTATIWLRLAHGDTAFDLLETIVPLTFAAQMNTGGTITGTPLLVGANSSSWTQTTYSLGSVDVTEPGRGGVPLLYPDLAFIDRVDVATAVLPASQRTYAPQIVLSPRAGGSTWQRTVAGGMAPHGLQARGLRVPPPIAALTSWGRGEATAGGPLGAGGMGLFVAATGTRSSHVERGAPARLPGDALSMTAHLTGAAASRVSVFSWLQQTRAPFSGRARFHDRDVDARTRLAGFTTNVRLARAGALEIAGGVQGSGTRIDADAGRANGTVERLRDGSVAALAAWAPGASRRWSVSALSSPTFIKWGREHTIRASAAVGSGTATATPSGTGFIGELLNGTPARAWQYGYVADTRWTQTTATVFASDTVTFGDVTATAGARLETVRASNAGAASVVRWTDLSPRLILAWAPNGNKIGRLFASINRYQSTLPLRVLAYGDPAAAQGTAFGWTDRNGDRTVQASEVGGPIAFVGPGSRGGDSSTIDPRLRRPTLDEFLLGTHANFGQWSFSFSGITWHQRRLLESMNVGVPASAYSLSHVFDAGLDLLGDQDDQFLPVYSRPAATFGRDAYVLTNPSRLTATHQGVTILVSRRVQERWHLMVGGTALRSKGPAGNLGFDPEDNDHGVAGESYGSPNATTHSTGRVLFDRGYGLKVAASYAGPRGINLGLVGRYADGQNFARVVIVPDLPQGPEAIRAFNNGRTKFTFTMTLDAKAEKGFRVRGGRLSAAVESFNLLNTRNEVEEDTVTGATWRLSTATQPPRVVRFALRAEF